MLLKPIPAEVMVYSVRKDRRMKRTHIFYVAALCALPLLPAQSSAQTTAATLDRMTAAGKSHQELAQYVFDNSRL